MAAGVPRPIVRCVWHTWRLQSVAYSSATDTTCCGCCPQAEIAYACQLLVLVCGFSGSDKTELKEGLGYYAIGAQCDRFTFNLTFGVPGIDCCTELGTGVQQDPANYTCYGWFQADASNVCPTDRDARCSCDCHQPATLSVEECCATSPTMPSTTVSTLLSIVLVIALFIPLVMAIFLTTVTAVDIIGDLDDSDDDGGDDDDTKAGDGDETMNPLEDTPSD